MLVQTVDFVIPPFVKVPCGDRVINCSANGKNEIIHTHAASVADENGVNYCMSRFSF